MGRRCTTYCMHACDICGMAHISVTREAYMVSCMQATAGIRHGMAAQAMAMMVQGMAYFSHGNRRRTSSWNCLSSPSRLVISRLLQDHDRAGESAAGPAPPRPEGPQTDKGKRAQPGLLSTKAFKRDKAECIQPGPGPDSRRSTTVSSSVGHWTAVP